MNLTEHKKKAAEFVGEGKGYVHAESDNGRTNLLISGDGYAIVHCLVAIANRLADITGMPFKDILGCAYTMKKYGYHALSGGKREMKHIEGEDLFEKELEEVKEQYKREADSGIAVVTQENSRLKQEKETLEHSIGLMKSAYEGRLNALQKQVKELTKEITKLEHEKMAIQRLVGKND